MVKLWLTFDCSMTMRAMVIRQASVNNNAAYKFTRHLKRLKNKYYHRWKKWGKLMVHTYASSSSLVICPTQLSTVDDRAFPVAAARVWNSLPQHVTSAQSLPVFRSRLMTHLFQALLPLTNCCAWEGHCQFSDTLIVFLTYILTCTITIIATELGLHRLQKLKVMLRAKQKLDT